MSARVLEKKKYENVTIAMIDAQQRALNQFKQLNIPNNLTSIEVEIADEEDSLIRTKITCDEYHKIKVETIYI